MHQRRYFFCSSLCVLCSGALIGMEQTIAPASLEISSGMPATLARTSSFCLVSGRSEWDENPWQRQQKNEDGSKELRWGSKRLHPDDCERISDKLTEGALCIKNRLQILAQQESMKNQHTGWIPEERDLDLAFDNASETSLSSCDSDDYRYSKETSFLCGLLQFLLPKLAQKHQKTKVTKKSKQGEDK